MAHIKGTGGRDNLPPISDQDESSPFAIKRSTSKEQLLSTHLEKRGYKFHTIPLIGGILKFFFGNLIAKKNYLDQLKKTLAEKLKGYTSNPQKLANNTFAPLKNYSLEEMQLVERFLENGGAPLFLYNSFAQNIEKILSIPPERLEGFTNMVRLTGRVAQMFGKRFTKEVQTTYQKEWLTLASDMELTSKDFNDLATKFENYCKEVQQIQNERPIVYLAEEKKALVDTGRELQSELTKMDSRFLAILSGELIDRTVVINHQVLEENIGSFTQLPSYDDRTIPNLATRTNALFSLSRQFHPDLTIYEEGQDSIDLTGICTRTNITDQKTGETRTLHIPLPLAGEMSKTEARKLLRVLKKTTHIPQDFDRAYAEEKLPIELQEQTKEAFLQWRDQAMRGLYALVLDFNATDSRPLFSFAREQPEIQRAIAEPKDESLALEAAKGQNIFILADGKTLSLLPPEIASNHPTIGQISPLIVENAKNTLINNNKKPISIELPGGKGNLTLKHTRAVIQENQVIWVEITIERGDRKKTRKILYEGESIQPYADSVELERDLLLAKSEFLEYVDRNRESLVHLQPALKDLPPTDRALILNFLLTPGGKAFVNDKGLDFTILLKFLKSEGGAIYAKVVADHPSNAINPAGLFAVLQTNPEGIQRAFKTYPQVAQMMGNRFNEAHHIDYMNAWIEMGSEDFKEVIEEFENYLKEAAKIQSERPKMYGEVDPVTLNFQQFNVQLNSRFDEHPLLQELVREIKNETIVAD